MKKRYPHRAYPTPGQQAALARLFRCVRVVFNDAVAAQRAALEWWRMDRNAVAVALVLEGCPNP